MKLISSAIVALQADLKPVKKNATNPFFKSKYSDLSTVMATIQPLLEKHKLAVLQPTTNIDGQSAIKTILIHESGERIEEPAMPLILPKNDPQAQGSAITYARRYSLCSFLGIVADKDDDGQRATEAVEVDPIATSKQSLYKAFVADGMTEFDDQKLFINSVLGKERIESAEEADRVLKELNKQPA